METKRVISTFGARGRILSYLPCVEEMFDLRVVHSQVFGDGLVALCDHGISDLSLPVVSGWCVVPSCV